MVGKHSTSSNTPSSPNLSLSKYPPIAPKNISYRAPLNLFSAIPSNHNNLESNHEQKSSLIQYNNLPSHYTTTSTPVKRILPNNRDPRLDPRITTTVESPKRVNFQSTPFLFQGVISKGGKYISSITLEGKQHCYHKEQIQELISTSGKNKEIRNEICISSFLPLKRLNDFIGNRELSFMAISAKDQIVEISKLKSFMQVNEIVGVVSHANKPTEALVILPTSELKKLTNLTAETDLEVKSYNQICAIYLDNLSKRPKIMDEMEYENEDELESSQLFLWNRVASYLRFPTRLKALRPLSQFLVYGQSESSLMLRRALVNEKNQSSIQTNPTNKQYVMMFDRYNGMLFNRSMLKHKKEPTTQIWEFGVHDLSSDEIASACEVFPNNTGGFITTDIENIVNNPDIINTISRQIKKFNEYSIAYGEWKFILPNNFIYHLDQAIRNKKLTEKMQTAIIEVTVALTKNTIQIMKLWPEEQEDMSFIHFMEGILQSYYKNYQHFVYVDDILSVSEDKRKHHLSIDFVQSDQIYNIYK
ncbi:uncharacterized protein BX663DRAFT_506922 [Cokeromyces recurvatus]|uniref:uncharacterized protein n=1 Tax=Cokeromyces recurvatus TaxID=90255 RepID=UPI00221E98E0|nr:uncharacterized protein BX663DRAFT_506922 [Cokeromyces recurvatus]KAI7903567.1 hypothetical protein BX663DRAFT_506922 [Cokeromyces recurvatus]